MKNVISMALALVVAFGLFLSAYHKFTATGSASSSFAFIAGGIIFCIAIVLHARRRQRHDHLFDLAIKLDKNKCKR